MFMLTPNCISRSLIPPMSARRGMLRSVTGWSVSSDAAISFSAEFLAPLIGISPLRRLPPRTRILSIFPLGAPAPVHFLVARAMAREQPRKERKLTRLLGGIRAFRRWFGGIAQGRLRRRPGRLLAPLQVLPEGCGKAFILVGGL